MQEGIFFGVLGPIEVRSGGVDVTPTAPIQRAILAALLIDAGTVVSTDRLIDAVWGEAPPATARSALTVHMTQLRRSLSDASHLLQTRRPGYVLQSEGVDADQYEALVFAARVAADDGYLQTAIETFSAAERLWRGPAYADCEYSDFARPEARRLNELRRAVTVQRVDAQLAVGDHLEVIGELETLTAHSPGDQRVWAQLMLALYRSGRQQDALEAYRRAADGLAELGLEPLAELRRLEEQILLEDPGLEVAQPHKVPPSNLPTPRSSFVGRHLELAKIDQLLDEYRLVTITGPGGVGKTRLALQAAGSNPAAFPGGTWLVDLGNARHADEVEAAWAEALGLSGTTSGIGRAAATRLGTEPSLIVVDNTEQVTRSAATTVGVVLDSCPAAAVIATGRNSLAIDGEAVLPLQPMPITEDSVRLLVDRVGALDPGFDAVDSARLREICERLDGLPLAVELAAAHIPTLGVDVILDRLRAGLGLPDSARSDGPPRHQTLWSTMLWSYDLLQPAERALLRRMGPFAGSPDLEAITAVCASDDLNPEEIPSLLAHLIRDSMVLNAGTGFAMLDTIREFAAAQLEEAGETLATTERHRTYYLDQAIDGPRRIGDTHQAWYRLFAANRLDFGTAISSAFESDSKRAARGYQTLAMFLNDTGRGAEARVLTARAMECLGELDDEHRATLLAAAGQVAFFSSDWQLASERLAEALELRRRIQDPHQLCTALNASGVALIRSPRFEEARGHFEEALAIGETLSDPMIESAPLTNLGISFLLSGPTAAAADHLENALHRQRTAGDDMSASISVSWLAADSWLRGDLPHAVELYDEAIAVNRRFDAQGFLARNLSLRADAVLELGDPAEAARDLRESLDLYETSGRRLHYAELVENCGFYVAAIDQPDSAAELLGASDGLRQRFGILEPVWNRARRNAIEGTIRTEMDDDGYAAAHRRGSLRGTPNVAALIRHTLG